MRLVALGGAMALLIALPVSASAAQRYASVTGAGTQCTSIAPCALDVAVNLAGTGDEVIVNPGTYTMGPTDLNAPAGSSVHGAAGQPKPLIVGNAIPTLESAGNGVTFSDLQIQSVGGFGVGISGTGSVAERIDSRTTSIRPCQVGSGATLRDSICVAGGSGGAGVWMVTSDDGTAYVRNVTAIATGPNSFGVYLQIPSNSDTNSVDLRGVIASGVSQDLFIGNSPGGVASITAAYSSWQTSSVQGFGTITPAGSITNQTAEPAFVNLAGGDYHQAAGSPTIDAGAADGRTGPLDVDGEARTQGPTADIGGDEFTVAPPPAADTTAPETTIDKGPKKKSRSKNATFSFGSSEEGATFSCTLDKKPASACTSPFKAKKLKPGKHRFSVAATDAAGNADSSPATQSWKVKKKRKRHR